MRIDPTARETEILDAAAQLIIQHGYDKTAIRDVAAAVGLKRSLVYASFKSEEDLLERLILREMKRTGQCWVKHRLADTQYSTVACIHRSIAYALRRNPFMAAIVKRSEGTFGKYLRRPGNLFATLQSQSMTLNLLQALQAAGTIRAGVNLAAVAYIMDVLSHSMVEHSHDEQTSNPPPYDELLETVPEMFDRMLTPEGGGNLEAGKHVLRQMAENARQHFDQFER